MLTHPTRCLIFKDSNAREDSTWAFTSAINAGTSTGGRLCREPRPHRAGARGAAREKGTRAAPFSRGAAESIRAPARLC
jgi:hypothetical protein